MENLNLLTGNKKDVATNTYAILLGKHDYTSRIQCARFRGTERVGFLDKKEYEGPLCEQIDGAYKFVLNYLSMAVEIDGIVHKEKYELPSKAIRKLIINAVIHRNYQMSSSVQVAFYDDRVDISSPGSIYGSLTLEESLTERSSIRNKTLARTLEKIDVLEGWGSGFKRIFAQNIDGEITIEEAKQLIDSYYETRQGRTEDEDDTEEADKVSVSIREILAIKEKSSAITKKLWCKLLKS